MVLNSRHLWHLSTNMQLLSHIAPLRVSLLSKRMLLRPRLSKMILQISLIRSKKFANTHFQTLILRHSSGQTWLTSIQRTPFLNHNKRYQDSGADTSNLILLSPTSRNTTRSFTISQKRRTENSPRFSWEDAHPPFWLVTQTSIISRNCLPKLTLRSISMFSSLNSNSNLLKQLAKPENFVKAIQSDIN